MLIIIEVLRFLLERVILHGNGSEVAEAGQLYSQLVKESEALTKVDDSIVSLKNRAMSNMAAKE